MMTKHEVATARTFEKYRTEIEQLKRERDEALARLDEFYKGESGWVRSTMLDDLQARVQILTAALRIIAGYQQCLDNLMSNVDVTRATQRRTAMTDDERKRMFDALTDPGEENNIVPAGYVDYLAHATDKQLEEEYDRRFPFIPHFKSGPLWHD